MFDTKVFFNLSLLNRATAPLYEFVAVSELQGLRTIVHVELLVDVLGVTSDGIRTNIQVTSNFTRIESVT